MLPLITVLIPTHGRPTLLGRTLASLAACRVPAGYAEAVVVENGPRAGTEAVVAEASAAAPHLRLRYLHVERANKSHALNEALATVGEGLVVFFDDDVRLEPGVLEAYAGAAARHPERAYFGGPTDVDYEAPPPESMLSFYPPSVRGVRCYEERLELILGCNWAAYAREVLSLGGFNPEFGPGSATGATGQETEMHRRLDAADFSRCVVSEAMVWHYVPRERSTAGWLFRRKYRHGLMAGLEESVGGANAIARRALGRGIICAAVAVKKFVLRDEEGFWRATLGLSTNAGRFVGALHQGRRSGLVRA